MPIKPPPIWKEAPFLRLIIPFITGIAVQCYLPINLSVSWAILTGALVLFFLFQFSKIFTQFKLYWLNGMLLNLLLCFTGILLTYYQDISHHPKWINNYYKDGIAVTVTLEEPLSEKEKSFKALASVQCLTGNDTVTGVKGSILLYFQKDSLLPRLDYGSQIIFKKPLVTVKNTGNPGAFDYQRYCAFQGIYQQVFLKPGEFIVLPQKKESIVKKWLLTVRSKTVQHSSAIPPWS
jgi:competence protein ComEC